MMRQNGFTLIELLAAMAAGGLLLGSLTWTISAFSRQVVETNVAAQFESLENARQVLDPMLSRIILVDDNALAFKANGHRLDAPVPSPMALFGKWRARLRLEVVREQNSAALLAYIEPIDVDPNTVGAVVETPHRLLTGFDDIEFRFDRVSQNAAGIPRVITIRASKNGSVSELNFTPRQDGRVGCVFDPISISCR